MVKLLNEGIILMVFAIALLPFTDMKNIPDKVMSIFGNGGSFNSVVQRLQLGKSLEKLKQIQKETNKHTPGRESRGSLVTLNNEECMPRPTVIAVPQPNDPQSFYYPYYVTLHRCSGACSHNPFGTTCESMATELLSIGVVDLHWGGGASENSVEPKIAKTEFLNHTQCRCACKNQANSCNKFQYWDQSKCRCECLGYCQGNYEHDPVSCCKCKQRKTCHKKQTWVDEECSCKCKKTAPCKNSLKMRDPNTCKCACEWLPCRPGFEQSQKTCQCEAVV